MTYLLGVMARILAERPPGPFDRAHHTRIALAPGTPAELYDLFRTAHPYRDLTWADYEAVVEMLSEGIATSRGRSGALLHRDQVNHKLRGRRGAKLAAITSGGAIPESAAYSVIAVDSSPLSSTAITDAAIINGTAIDERR